jgi:hypothetical protein
VHHTPLGQRGGNSPESAWQPALCFHCNQTHTLGATASRVNFYGRSCFAGIRTRRGGQLNNYTVLRGRTRVLGRVCARRRGAGTTGRRGTAPPPVEHLYPASSPATLAEALGGLGHPSHVTWLVMRPPGACACARRGRG